jgi:hypothetical protein
MKAAWLAVLAVVPGCYSAEASIGREGLIHGNGAGGVAMNLLAATYYETGKQNIAVGGDMQLLQHGSGGIAGTLGAGARFAQQLGDSGRWRGFSRASFGVEHCRLTSCKPDMQLPHRDVLEIQLGIEHMLVDKNISSELGFVYTHASDDALGVGNYIGFEIGLHVQVDLFARSGQ